MRRADGVADDVSSLEVSDEERFAVASVYGSSASLLRVPVRHFSTWAFGFSFGGPATAKPPTRAAPVSPVPLEIIHESVELASTELHLVYSGDRVVGFEAPRTLDVPLAGESVPVGLLRIESELHIAGNKLTRTSSPSAHQVENFVWDGIDAYGRALQGGQPARVRVAYIYPSAVYAADPETFIDSFAQALGRSDFVVEVPSASTVALVQEWRGTLGGWDARGQGLGGWSLDVHHAYDPGARILYEGN
ncbi:MAG: hypothetical protein HYV07_11030, partial [Deltaproteobacteria bacterium]|nr:hypothetical protein [Deltaproteobacteria bacterium]